MEEVRSKLSAKPSLHSEQISRVPHGKNDRTSGKSMFKQVKPMRMLLPALAEVNENRPPTPLTPSLDPELLREFEKEDLPRRARRASTIAATLNSSLKAKNRINRRTTSFSSNIPRSADKNKSSISRITRTNFSKLEVKIDNGYSVCTPSTSGMSSITSASSFNCQNLLMTNEKLAASALKINSQSSWLPDGVGEPKSVYLNNAAPPVKRLCFTQVHHRVEAEVIRLGDSVVVKSDDNSTNFGCLQSIYLDPQLGVIMGTVIWYYKPDQMKVDLKSVEPYVDSKELFVSKHIDSIPLDSVEELICVIKFEEYNRYVAENKADSLPKFLRPLVENVLWPRAEVNYPRRKFLPCEDTPVELVYFTRRMYDFVGKRIVVPKPKKRTRRR